MNDKGEGEFSVNDRGEERGNSLRMIRGEERGNSL